VVKEYEKVVGTTQSAIVAASKRANNLFETLTPDEKEQVTYDFGWMILIDLAMLITKNYDNRAILRFGSQ